jgi:hypothetical protein
VFQCDVGVYRCAAVYHNTVQDHTTSHHITTHYGRSL